MYLLWPDGFANLLAGTGNFTVKASPVGFDQNTELNNNTELNASTSIGWPNLNKPYRD